MPLKIQTFEPNGTPYETTAGAYSDFSAFLGMETNLLSTVLPIPLGQKDLSGYLRSPCHSDVTVQETIPMKNLASGVLINSGTFRVIDKRQE